MPLHQYTYLHFTYCQTMLPRVNFVRAMHFFVLTVLIVVIVPIEINLPFFLAFFCLMVAYPRDERRKQIPSINILEYFDMALLSVKEIARAANQGKFLVFYQPQISSEHWQPLYVEALVRWRRDDGTIIPPSAFLSRINSTKKLDILGRHVIRQSLQDLCLMRRVNPELKLAVNVNISQLETKGFVAFVERELIKNRVKPYNLELELTEVGLDRLSNRAGNALTKLKKLGVSLALDDFGKGGSGKTRLQSMDWDTLKIDRNDLKDLIDNPKSITLLSSVIQLGKANKLRVVAEGVETQMQALTLKAMGVDELQGYLFAKPMNITQTQDWLLSYADDVRARRLRLAQSKSNVSA